MRKTQNLFLDPDRSNALGILAAEEGLHHQIDVVAEFAGACSCAELHMYETPIDLPLHLSQCLRLRMFVHASHRSSVYLSTVCPISLSILPEPLLTCTPTCRSPVCYLDTCINVHQRRERQRDRERQTDAERERERR